MRSQWKTKHFLLDKVFVKNGGIHLVNRRGFLNPYFKGLRLHVYTGGRFRNYKVRPEMVVYPLNSFVSTRPSFSSIRKKFLSLRKKRR